jgi:hypothetical protein
MKIDANSKKPQADEPERKSLADELQEKVVAIASKATDVDRQLVSKIIKRAETGKKACDIVTLTPATCALLFLTHNSHNRAWRPNSSVEYARRMSQQKWKWNSTTIGFYVDGIMEDGQHRTASAALSGFTWEVVVVYGIERDAIDTVDDNMRRSGADHAGLDGITDANRKQQIVKSAAGYFVKAGNKDAALRSPAEVKAAIETDNQLLELAMDIGTHSRDRIATPALAEAKADAIAFVLLKAGWPEARIRERLALFQTGVSTLGEADPLYVAASLLDNRRKKAARGEKLNTAKEMGITIYALLETEKGTKAINLKHIRAAVDGKNLPDPTYPSAPPMQEAA